MFDLKDEVGFWGLAGAGDPVVHGLAGDADVFRELRSGYVGVGECLPDGVPPCFGAWVVYVHADTVNHLPPQRYNRR